MEGFGLPNSTAQKTKVNEKVDYSNLPCPLPYEEISREAMICFKTDLFEGFRLDFNKNLNHKFSLSHSVLMGPAELPDQPSGSGVIKTPTSNYRFGANFFDPKLMLIGSVLTDGTLEARVKCDLTDNLAVGGYAQLTNEEDKSHGGFACDYKGSDYRTRLQITSGSLFIANYIQHVTPRLSLGGDVFWYGELQKSGVGYAARYETDEMIAVGKVASTGITIMNYVHKVTEKVSLAAEFVYNFMSRDAIASIGYHCNLRQCQLRGRIDSNGVASAYLEEQLAGPGLRFLLSAEMDHVKKDYKFGFGLTIG